MAVVVAIVIFVCVLGIATRKAYEYGYREGKKKGKDLHDDWLVKHARKQPLHYTNDDGEEFIFMKATELNRFKLEIGFH